MAYSTIALTIALISAFTALRPVETSELMYDTFGGVSPLDIMLEAIPSLKAAQGYGYGNISKKCFEDFVHYATALKSSQLWAIQMADATGKVPSGILIGNAIEFGSFSECTFANITAISAENDKYSPEYCVSNLRVNTSTATTTSKPMKFLYGLCLPVSCSESDVLFLLQLGLAYAEGKDKLAPIASRITPVSVTCQKRTLEYTAWAIAAITLISIFLALITAATLYDLYRVYRNDLIEYYYSVRMCSAITYKFHSPSRESLAIVNSGILPSTSYSTYEQENTTNLEAPRDSVVSLVSNSGKELSGNGASVGSAGEAKEEMKAPGLLGRLLLCFSLLSNGEKVMNTSPPKTAAGDDQIGCAHGIRFISMTWVILGHTFFVVSSVTGNGFNYLTQFTQYVNYFGFMAVTSGILSVDTFFTMSGMLTCYLTLKGLRKLGGPLKLNWGLFYLHRYLRLTPAYAAVMFITMPLFRHLYYGPIWPQNESLEKACADNWWSNLLYVNNLVYDNPSCMGHSWFLANDMQFYIISPLVMIPWFYSPIAGFLISGLLVVCSVVSTAVIVVHRNYTANILVPGPPPEGDYVSMFHDVYTKPYSRVGTYAVGMMAGYLMYRFNLDPARKERFMVVHRGQILVGNLIGWIITALLCLAAVYSPYDMQRGATVWSAGMNAFYMSCARLGWSAGVAYIIMSCAFGYGGWVNRFLSWRLFMPLSRLTYAAYLIHFYVIEFLYWSAEQPLSLSVINVIYYYFGHIALSYALAFALSMMFEAPMFCLEKIIFKR